MRRALITLFLIALPLLASAQAASQLISPADARMIRAVIEAQLDAFRHDDAARAFSYAAPGIRETFGSPQNFLEMVRTQYTVVYRPSRVEFEQPLIAEGDVVQPVRFTDGEGNLWLAIYPMEREKNGVWRINGCYLDRMAGQQI